MYKIKLFDETLSWNAMHSVYVNTQSYSDATKYLNIIIKIILGTCMAAFSMCNMLIQKLFSGIIIT